MIVVMNIDSAMPFENIEKGSRQPVITEDDRQLQLEKSEVAQLQTAESQLQLSPQH
jgi:hypothetical protein